MSGAFLFHLLLIECSLQYLSNHMNRRPPRGPETESAACCVAHVSRRNDGIALEHFCPIKNRKRHLEHANDISKPQNKLADYLNCGYAYHCTLDFVHHFIITSLIITPYRHRITYKDV